MSKSFFFFGFGTNGQSPIHDDEGHVRITKMDHGIVGGGTKETHERTVDTGIRINEAVSNVYRKYGDSPDPRRFRDATSEILDGE